MNGLSEKLSSLVGAADDPYAFYYAFTHLGIGVPEDPKGFGSRVRLIRDNLIKIWLEGQGPSGQMRRLQKEMENELKLRQQEQQREMLEVALLNAQEQQLAVTLFQKSNLNLLVRRVAIAKPEELRAQTTNKNPLIRLLVIQAIGQRHLHREAELIDRLNDPDFVVRDAAHKALVRVARGTDFGPLPGFSLNGIAHSIDKWRHWLALQNGESSEALSSVLSHSLHTLPTVSPNAMRLCNELVKARGEERNKVLERLRDTKGIDNSDALALAIPKLGVGVQRQVREALAQRLTRMKATTLRDKLEEDNPEVRRAAALACGRKKATELIPELLKLLDDPEVAVIQSARRALKELTGEDFGPDEEAGRIGRVRAAAAWRKWWAKKPSAK